MFKVELLAIAENELSDSYDWYEEQQIGLGNRFYNDVNYYLSLLENNPHQFPIKYIDELRSVSIYKFPFVIIYWIDESNTAVYVVSVFHTSRNPRVF
ncbi:MAG: plasmid stabilization system [Mucilaginibacter sp.]|uniref:type II toxin-antitoxin system RelE/ParE family toxin n=1 Tax=Mucilaginibacter sp. TaxID=1882438 RepID=UPI00345C6AAA|nr:plasmid stabilization system [Mucilaginibacter sp.]